MPFLKVRSLVVGSRELEAGSIKLPSSYFLLHCANILFLK
jgi:hypothetical protein